MANRIRNVYLKINLTEEKKALFEKKMKMAECKIKRNMADILPTT